MDAGARGRRLLQRREYRAKVSEFIPKELEDQYASKGEVISELDLKKAASKLKTGLKNWWNKPIMKDTPTQKQYKNSVEQGTSNQYQSYEPEGEMIEANSAQMRAMHDAKLKKKEDDKVASKKKDVKEESELERIQRAIKTKTMNGKPLTDEQIQGLKAGLTQGGNKVQEGTKYGLYKGSGKASGAFKDYLDKKKKEKKKKEVSEDMKGMSQKSGDKRSTESGAGMTAKGVAKYNRRTGGNLKTAVTTPPSKLKPGSKAAKRRKSFCARSKSWDGPRGKAARRRWNCSYEPELPMIIDEKKKLYNSSPLAIRVAKWSKGLKEGDVYVKSNRNRLTGLPNLGKGDKKTTEKKITGVNYATMAQSYEPQGQVIQEMPDDIKSAIMTNLRGGAGDFSKGGNIKDIIKNRLKSTAKDVINTDTVKKTLNMGEMARKGKGAINSDVLKDNPNLDPLKPGDYIKLKRLSAKVNKINEESCGKGEYYCNDDQKCKPIPDGYKEGKDGMLVKEAKYEKGASTYGKASIRNKRMFGKGGNAADPKERGAAIKVRRARHQERRYVKKGNKYHEPGKHRPEVHGVNKPEEERKGKNVKENAVVNKIMNDLNFIQKAKDTVGNYNKKLKQNNDAINKVMPGSATLNNEGNLHKWFKGSKSKDGKPGWVNVVTGGTCASDKPGEGTPKCVSSSKRASMTKAERLSASRRKKKADPNQQSKSGAAKPTYVATDKKKKKVDENAGPSTPVTRVGNGFLPNLGVGRLNDKKIRLKINPLAGLPKV